MYLLTFCISAILAFLPFIFCELPTCQMEDFHWEYTECDSNGARWRVQVPDPNTCEGGAPRPPVRGAACNKMCEKGEFLDIQHDQVCRPCPAGSYSLGGGVVFEDWSSLPSGFTTESWFIGHMFSEITGKDVDFDNGTACQGEGWLPQDKYIISVPTQCSSRLVYTVDLVVPGAVKFLYQYDEKSENILHFVVKSSSECLQKSESIVPVKARFPAPTGDSEWGTIEVALPAGNTQLIWRSLQVGFHTGSTFKKAVKIKSIAVTGIAFMAECSVCAPGAFSGEGSAVCEECPMNTYSLKNSSRCAPCNTDQYSMAGASECMKRPPCTVNDYYQYHSPCRNGFVITQHDWNPKKICDADLPGSVTLPQDSEPQPCPPCNPGMFLGEDGTCGFCPKGTYSDGNAACEPCPASTAPEYSLNLQYWNNLPLDANLSSNCISSDDKCCNTDQGWAVSLDHIHSLDGHCDSAFLVFIIEVGGFWGRQQFLSLAPDGATVAELAFVFEIGCDDPQDDCSFIFMKQTAFGDIDVVETWRGSVEQTVYKYKIPTPLASKFTWAFQKRLIGDKSESRAWARVHSVKVTNTLNGGAAACRDCPQGANQEGCVPCPKNNYFDPLSKHCVRCPAGTIANTQGQHSGSEACVACGEGLTVHSGLEFDHCVTTCTYKSPEGRQYDFTGLSSPKTVQAGNMFTLSGLGYFYMFNISLCGGSYDWPLARCADNVTSDLSTSDTLEIRSPVCRTTIVPPMNNEPDITIAAQAVSFGDILVAVTTNVTSVDLTARMQKEGFEPADSSLAAEDVHFVYKSEGTTQACTDGRTTIITLRCDPTQPDNGTIKVPPKCLAGTCDGCVQHFLWLSERACPKCTDDVYMEVKGECKGGLQQIHFLGPSYCPLKESTHGQHCTVLPFWLMVTIGSMCCLAVVLCGFVVYCWNMNKTLEYKYMKLVAPTDGREDCELPAAETCGMSDDEEEEDQFDAVRFTEGNKKSKFFNKIKSMGSKKGDNPFENISMSDREPLT